MFKFSSHVKEEHGQPLFGVQFNWYLEEDRVFASVGGNRATIYSCHSDGSITALQAYSDADSEENFYTCAWSYDSETRESLLAIAGLKGIIRVIGTSRVACAASYSGHGNAINELKTHPTNPQLLLSASKDHALRLWNLKTSVCIAIFGGVEGHRDEVLSADFNFSGTRILSCGMDHALKIWELDSDGLQQSIKESFDYQRNSKRSFPTLSVHFPSFSTRDIHRNYVDCVQWFGRLALSKSCENCVVLWRPPPPGETSNTPTILHKLDVLHCDIWFIRFCLDYQQELLILGNTTGRIFVWDLTTDDPIKLSRSHALTHPKCNAAIRQVTISKDGTCLISVCDSGSVWRWDKRDAQKK